jgi:hypothetical protein
MVYKAIFTSLNRSLTLCASNDFEAKRKIAEAVDMPGTELYKLKRLDFVLEELDTSNFEDETCETTSVKNNEKTKTKRKTNKHVKNRKS